jgi:RimJ/RimL family protein N-acetyltransferase
MLLEANGFRFVEMVYRPSLSPIPAIARIDGDLAVSEARLEDLPAIEAIAEGAFSTGRFLLDWRLDRKSSHRRYATWVRNSFEDPRQAVLKACLGGDIVGFFVVEDRPDLSAYWHLTAIATRWQGKGIGKRLWREMVARHHAAGQQRIETTISAHNPSVMNIYAGLGFRFNSPQTTFHWVRQ